MITDRLHAAPLILFKHRKTKRWVTKTGACKKKKRKKKELAYRQNDLTEWQNTKQAQHDFLFVASSFISKHFQHEVLTHATERSGVFLQPGNTLRPCWIYTKDCMPKQQWSDTF